MRENLTRSDVTVHPYIICSDTATELPHQFASTLHKPVKRWLPARSYFARIRFSDQAMQIGVALKTAIVATQAMKIKSTLCTNGYCDSSVGKSLANVTREDCLHVRTRRKVYTYFKMKRLAHGLRLFYKQMRPMQVLIEVKR